MGSSTIITIGRQFGSGGHEIAEKLAKTLNIPFYDKELIKRAAKESGLCEEIFENFDEKPSSSFLYSLVMDPYSLGYSSNGYELPLNHKVFLAAFDTIKKIADEGSCVIVGRCADYALQDRDDVLSIFIKAPIETRIKRISNKYELTDLKAKDMIYKNDKQRAGYYNYYSTKKWADIKSYDLIIDSEVLGIDGTVEMLADYYKRFDSKND